MSPLDVSSWPRGSVGQCEPGLGLVILNGLAHAFKYPARTSLRHSHTTVSSDMGQESGFMLNNN